MPIKDVDITQRQPVNALLYGPSNGGKTSFIGTWDRVAVIVTEKTSSLGALSDLHRRTGIKPVRVAVAENRDDVSEFLEWLEQPATRQIVGTVAFDSITQHGNNLLLQVIDEHKAVFGKALRTPENPEMQDWQRILIPELRLIKRLSDMGYSTVMTAHARTWIDPISRRKYRIAQATGQTKDMLAIPETYYPNLRGQLGDVLPHFFNLVAFMYFDTSVGEWRACFRQTGTYFAKTQYSLLPDMIVNPTYDLMLQGKDGKLAQIAPEPEPDSADEEDTVPNF